MKTNKSNTRNRKSMKGKWGHVGAPPKKTSWPTVPFTMETLFKRNKNQCELSLRNKVDDRIADESLIKLNPRKQKGGAVGRPKSVFILADKFNEKKHVKFGQTTPVKVRKVKARVVAVETATPAIAPVTVPPLASPVGATAPATIEPPVEVVTVPDTSAPVETVVATVEAPASTPEVTAPASEPVVAQ
jgi:hypothetical protein